jgi:TolA-binding protein
LSRIKNLYFAVACLIIVGLAGCRGFKNTKLGHHYHNLTAHYNAYFNGREKLKDVETRLYDATEDNYSTVLAIYPIGTEAAAKSASGDLDYVIKKGTKVIKKHDVSDWVDDGYVLIGKANYYKRDYFSAIETFQYITQKYPKEETGKEAQLWIARSYLELNKPNDAQAQLSVMKRFGDLSDKLKAEYNVVEADYYIRSEEYKLAAEKLEKALPDVSVRKYRIRYYFILGQLYARLGNTKKASKFYNEVIHRVAPYELSFQAKMGLADSYEAQTEKGKKDIKLFLFKLTKDAKNTTYLDQVYFQLAKIELKEGNVPKAMDYLKTSARKSTKNNFQKALSYTTLGDLYFKKPDYPLSKAYYDSANLVATKDFPNYEKFKKRQKTLSDLIANLIVIQNQDSLQRLAHLPKSQLDMYVDAIAAADKQASLQKKQQLDQKAPQGQDDAAQQNFAVNFDNSANTNNGSAGQDPTAIFGGSNNNGFYFDNPALVTAGAGDFIRKWGRRPLQDDWRRKSKSNNPGGINPNLTENPKNTEGLTKNGDNQIIPKPKDSTSGINSNPAGSNSITNDAAVGEIPSNKQQYYKDIPFTKAQQNFSNKKIEEALYNAGTIYLEQLKELEKATAMYEDLLSRFPDGKYLLKAHYYLYKTYDNLGDSINRDIHKNFILKNYPGSEYAILIRSPEMLRQKLARKQNPELEALYSKTFQLYQEDKCEEVQHNFTASIQFDKNYLLPKFDYLRAICPLKHDTGKVLLDTLKAYSQRYPGDEMAGEAAKLLKFLEDKRITERNKPKTDSGKVERVSPYKKNDTLNHYYIFSFPLAKSDLNQVKIEFLNYNKENFGSQNLELISTVFKENNFVIVRNFADEKRTLAYYKAISRSKEFYDKLKLPTYQDFIISDENFRTLQQDKDMDLYIKFFRNNY